MRVAAVFQNSHGEYFEAKALYALAAGDVLEETGPANPRESDAMGGVDSRWLPGGREVAGEL